MNFDAHYTMTIDGREAVTSQTLPVINPADEKIIAHAPCATIEDLNRAVASAKAAFPLWAARPITERQEFLLGMGACLTQYKEELMQLLTREQGKPRAGAEWELDQAIHWCNEMAKLQLPVELVEDSAARTIEIRHTPIGVVGAITPWNYPVLLSIWKILPALLAGNTMVLKPSPYTPLTLLKLGELLRDVLPAGVLNVVAGDNALGQWLTTHPDVGKVTFTGSTETGKKVMESAAGTLKRLTLELGGNDAAIVLPDIDVKQTAKNIFWAAFQNSAQLCVAAKRLYIHTDIYDAVAQELVSYAKTVVTGDGSKAGVDLGPVQNKMQFDKVQSLLADAREQGLRFLWSGKVPQGPGYFIPVTIIDNPPETSRVVVEEAFGPVLPLLRFSTIDEVVLRANDSIYGLGASVWSADPIAARKIAERLETGTVWINEIHAFSPHATFAGHKQSGLGVEHAIQGLLEFTNAQSIITRKTDD